MKKLKFIPVSGQEVLDQIYDKEHNDFYLEEVIEDVYKMLTYKASATNVMTVKKGFYKSREKTDGYMTFSLNGKELFYGIQEVKRKVGNNANQYRKQLLQALRYLWLYRNDPSIKVFVLNSEKFYSFVLRKDIENLIEELAPLFELSTKSACRSWDDPALKRTILNAEIPFHTVNINELELSVELKKIYKLVA